VALGLAEEKQGMAEAAAAGLRHDLSRLQEERRSCQEDVRLEAAKVERLQSELQRATAELQQKDAVGQAQRHELEQRIEKEALKQERSKGELAALRQELARAKQLACQEVEAHRKDVEKAFGEECERLHLQVRAQAAEIRQWRSEALAHAERAPQPEAELAAELRSELGQAEAAFAEELSSMNLRLATAERRNRELLENLQTTLQASRPYKEAPLPVGLPAPPKSLPEDNAFAFREVEQRDKDSWAADVENSENSERSSSGWKQEQQDHWRQQLWNRQRQSAERDLWQLQKKQKEKEEQLKREQENRQRQQLHMQPKDMLMESTITMNSDYYGATKSGYTEQEDGGSVSSTSTVKRYGTRSRHLVRLPSAPILAVDINDDKGPQAGEALRRAARQRRAAVKTRSLDDEYVRFVHNSRRPASVFAGAAQDVRRSRPEGPPSRPDRVASKPEVEPFVLSDLVAG